MVVQVVALQAHAGRNLALARQHAGARIHGELFEVVLKKVRPQGAVVGRDPLVAGTHPKFTVRVLQAGGEGLPVLRRHARGVEPAQAAEQAGGGVGVGFGAHVAGEGAGGGVYGETQLFEEHDLPPQSEHEVFLRFHLLVAQRRFDAADLIVGLEDDQVEVVGAALAADDARAHAVAHAAVGGQETEPLRFERLHGPPQPPVHGPDAVVEQTRLALPHVVGPRAEKGVAVEGKIGVGEIAIARVHGEPLVMRAEAELVEGLQKGGFLLAVGGAHRHVDAQQVGVHVARQQVAEAVAPGPQVAEGLVEAHVDVERAGQPEGGRFAHGGEVLRREAARPQGREHTECQKGE